MAVGSDTIIQINTKEEEASLSTMYDEKRSGKIEEGSTAAVFTDDNRNISEWDSHIPEELSKGKIKMKAVDDEEEKGEELLASCGSLVLGHQINHVALLLSACLTTFGAYFAKDILSAESIHIMKHFKLNKAKYGAINGLPGIPNIFASPIGGLIVDAMGSDRSCLLFALMVFLGSIFTSSSIPHDSLTLLIVGQFFQGLSKGSLIAAQKVFLKIASDSTEVGLFYALSFSASHAGTFCAFFLSPLIERGSSLGWLASIYTMSGMCFFSVLCSIPLIGKIKHVPFRRHHQPQQPHQEEAATAAVALVATTDEEKGATTTPVPHVAPQQEPAPDSNHHHHHHHPRCNGLRHYCEDIMTIPFFLVVVSIVCYYLSFFPFVVFAVDFLKTDHGFEPEQASLAASLLTLASVILGPLFGLRVDTELGKRGRLSPQMRRFFPPGSIQLWAMVLAAGGLLLTSQIPDQWAIGFVMIGLGFAMASSSLWPMIPVFVKPASLGLAFGLSHLFMDMGLMLVNILIGNLVDQGYTYEGCVLYILMAMACVALLATIGLMGYLHQRDVEWRQQQQQQQQQQQPPQLLMQFQADSIASIQ